MPLRKNGAGSYSAATVRSKASERITTKGKSITWWSACLFLFTEIFIGRIAASGRCSLCERDFFYAEHARSATKIILTEWRAVSIVDGKENRSEN